MAVFCSRCGKPLADGAAFCPSCGAAVLAAGATPAGAAAGAPADGSSMTAEPAASAIAATPRYAGFWRRFWAFIIDGFVIGIVMMPFGLGLWGTIAALGAARRDSAETLAGIIAASMMVWMLRVLASWLYGALFESSAWQATPGKKLFGLRVTDLEGRRISFLRATGRAFGKWLSGLILCIGFIMVAFTEKKQGLHDLLAGTVVRR
jgi:uncharacterized RDD family membrane protein YckC